MINNPGTNLLPAQINRRFDFSRRRRCSAAANPRHKLAADGDGVFIECQKPALLAQLVERSAYKWEVGGSIPIGVVLVEGFVHRSVRPRRCYQRIPTRAADGTTFPATNYGSEIRVVVSP